VSVCARLYHSADSACVHGRVCVPTLLCVRARRLGGCGGRTAAANGGGRMHSSTPVSIAHVHEQQVYSSSCSRLIACMCVLCVRARRLGGCGGRTAWQMAADAAAALARSPWWQANEGVDHMYLSSDFKVRRVHCVTYLPHGTTLGKSVGPTCAPQQCLHAGKPLCVMYHATYRVHNILHKL
jgi:hypothetical protein